MWLVKGAGDEWGFFTKGYHSVIDVPLMRVSMWHIVQRKSATSGCVPFCLNKPRPCQVILIIFAQFRLHSSGKTLITPNYHLLQGYNCYQISFRTGHKAPKPHSLVMPDFTFKKLTPPFSPFHGAIFVALCDNTQTSLLEHDFALLRGTDVVL